MRTVNAMVKTFGLGFSLRCLLAQHKGKNMLNEKTA